MSGRDQVDRQLREKQTYNLFYSALTARASPCLAEHGWRAPIKFGTVYDPFEQVTCEPDFVLYDGDTVLLVEIKSGNNITERHVKQVTRFNEISIDGMENQLEEADVEEKTPYDGSVTTIDRCIVYQDIDEAWVEQCREEWDSCQEQLEDLEEQAAVLTQDFGGALRRVAGEFNSNRLQRRFDEGVELPEKPKEEFVLTEQMENEILAIAICGIWGEQALGHESPVQVNVNQIRDYFAPTFNVPPNQVNRVLYFLQEIDACDHVEDLTYKFARSHIPEVIQITQTVRGELVEDALEDVDEDHIPDEQQSTFDMISEEGVVNGGEVDDELGDEEEESEEDAEEGEEEDEEESDEDENSSES